MFLVLLGTTSCIKDEAANAEADILSVSVDNDVLLRNPIVSNDEVKLFTADSTDLSNILTLHKEPQSPVETPLTQIIPMLVCSPLHRKMAIGARRIRCISCVLME